MTQRFAEAHVHPPMPDDRYPWAQYNSWGYDQEIDEAQQMEAIERCAAVGVEVVVHGPGLGRADRRMACGPRKVPARAARHSPTAAHALGLKFGVHIPLAQANVDSPVAREHPGLAHRRHR